MILASFQIEDKLEKVWFFQETFILANFSKDVVLRILFLTFSNVNIKFAWKKFLYRFYTTVKAPLIIKQIEIIGKKKFTKAVLDENVGAFIVHMTFFGFNLMPIHLV